jgi:hypothetical protein
MGADVVGAFDAVIGVGQLHALAGAGVVIDATVESLMMRRLKD